MGAAKAWLVFGGETLLQRTVRTVASVAAPVVVVAAVGQEVPPLPEGIAVVRDARSGRGPLQGLAAGLEAVAPYARAAFVSSTDAPFLHPAMIRRLAELREEHEAVVPRAGGRLHPLCAMYGIAARDVIAELLAGGNLRLTLLCERLGTLVADEALLLAGAELALADPALRSLWNVNTPEEYAAALKETGGG
jgi:molybdenum cofactor guanylyltransferase